MNFDRMTSEQIIDYVSISGENYIELRKEAMLTLKIQQELAENFREPYIGLHEIRIIKDYLKKHSNLRYIPAKHKDSESFQHQSFSLYRIIALSFLSFVLGILATILVFY